MDKKEIRCPKCNRLQFISYDNGKEDKTVEIKCDKCKSIIIIKI